MPFWRDTYPSRDGSGVGPFCHGAVAVSARYAILRLPLLHGTGEPYSRFLILPVLLLPVPCSSFCHWFILLYIQDGADSSVYTLGYRRVYRCSLRMPATESTNRRKYLPVPENSSRSLMKKGLLPYSLTLFSSWEMNLMGGGRMWWW